MNGYLRVPLDLEKASRAELIFAVLLLLDDRRATRRPLFGEGETAAAAAAALAEALNEELLLRREHPGCHVTEVHLPLGDPDAPPGQLDEELLEVLPWLKAYARVMAEKQSLAGVAGILRQVVDAINREVERRRRQAAELARLLEDKGG